MIVVCVCVCVNLHFSFGGVLGARDVEGVQVNMVSIHSLDDEHLEEEELCSDRLSHGPMVI